MTLTINNKKFDFFNQFSLQLRFDAIASAFGFAAYFDSGNAEHKALLKPLSYARAVVEHNGEVLVTGTIIGNTFKDAPQKQLCTVSGYSVTGVLEDCEIPTSLYPLQSDGLTLKQIAEKLLKPFNIGMVISDSVKAKMDKTYNVTNAKATQTIKSYLTELAAQENIILTHTAGGSLLFTEAKADLKPVQDFERGAPGLEFSLSINGQAMHSDITVIKEADIDSPNAGEATVKNNLVTLFRPKVVVQSSGDENSTEQAAKNVRAEELKNIKLSISMNTDRWLTNNKVIRPNMMISVTDAELFIYKKVNWFVESVKIDKTSEKDMAVIECVLPWVYNGGEPVNIFN